MVTQIEQRAEGSLSARFQVLCALRDDTLQQELRDFIEAEHELPEPERYAATLRRLDAWLEFEADDRDMLVEAYERATAALPEEYAHRRREVETTVVLNAMTYTQFSALSVCLPFLQPAAG